jgi:MFS family permease
MHINFWGERLNKKSPYHGYLLEPKRSDFVGDTNESSRGVAINGSSFIIRNVSSKIGLSNLPLQVYVILAVGLVLSLSRMISFPYLAMYLSGETTQGGIHLSPTLIGTITMSSSLAGTFALLIGGSLTDRFGRKKVIIFSLFPYILIVLGIAVAKTYSEFLYLMIVGGTISALFDPAINAMIADLVQPNRREEVYGLSYMLANVGTVIGPLVGGYVANRIGYSILFIFTAILNTVCACAILLWIRESRPKGVIYNMSLKQFTEIFKHKIFIFFCFLMMLTNIVYAQFYGLLSVYTGYLGFEPYSFGMLLSVNGLMVVFLQIPIRKASTKLGSKRAFIIAQAFYGIGFLYFMFSTTFNQFLIGVIILTIGEIVFTPAVMGFVANLSPVDRRGRYLSISSLFSGVGGSIGSMIGFWLLGTLVDKALTWGIIGIIGFLTLFGYIYLFKTSK